MIIIKLLQLIWIFAGILFLIGVVHMMKSCSEYQPGSSPHMTPGWSDQILDGQKGAIIREFPNFTNEQRSEILLRRAEIERLKAVRDGHLDPDWRPSGWTDPFKDD